METDIGDCYEMKMISIACVFSEGVVGIANLRCVLGVNGCCVLILSFSW